MCTSCALRSRQVIQSFGFYISKMNINTLCRRGEKNIRRGTTPVKLDDEGVTANVVLIISSTEAIEPRVRVPGGLLSLAVPVSFSKYRPAPLAKVSNEFRVMGLRILRPGSLVFQLVYDSTNTITNNPDPIRTPPSIQNCRVKKMRPRRMG